MILKQLRLSRGLSQEQLAHMSGLNVRTIQRIEAGANASLESKKCLASALDVSIQTLELEELAMTNSMQNWRALPIVLKVWFVFNFLQVRPKRCTANRVVYLSHTTGFLFCGVGLVHEAALVGGLMLLGTAYLFSFLKWQGDKYDIWRN
ncbi:helix-turn-helix domain-containing protein [Pseudoalteromonas luteoviolacea]|uniref:helix-turn-helix domain-containing protein n=1 Tax=Pseudoalteromonas luteoviolacea TaxID=43657 RepID=UPI001F189C80|nr:helix-turn-helix transcriptional regulator [Pseudoalteromonas luteoviolacea]MCF6438779.1 helix-turn-helix domain-containing protein [Pseudoalteromonas luteoviolacea]